MLKLQINDGWSLVGSAGAVKALDACSNIRLSGLLFYCRVESPPVSVAGMLPKHEWKGRGNAVQRLKDSLGAGDVQLYLTGQIAELLQASGLSVRWRSACLCPCFSACMARGIYFILRSLQLCPWVWAHEQNETSKKKHLQKCQVFLTAEK